MRQSISFVSLLNLLLCPPGQGVYTYSATGRQQHNFATRDSWQQQLATIKNNTKPMLLGISSDCGGGINRGANWGPFFIRKTLFSKQFDIETKIFDLGDIRVIPQLLHDKYLNADTITNCREFLYGKYNVNVELPVSPLSITEYLCAALYSNLDNCRLLALGGDHSISYPLVKTFLQQHKNAGVLHFDAHTDLLASRMGIDLCFGTWTYHILPYLPQPDALLQVGIRASNYDKQYWQQNLQVAQIWAEEVNQNDPIKIANLIVDHFSSRNIKDIYLSFDIDCIDAKFASATGTPEINGLHPDAVVAIIDHCSQSLNIKSADITEVAPFSCSNLEARAKEPGSTLEVAGKIAKVILPALGYPNV